MVDLERADYAENTDLTYDGGIDPSSVEPENIEENDITEKEEGEDRVFVYEDGGPIVFGMVFDLDDPRRVKLQLDGEWRADGELIDEFSFGHDEEFDAGEGRFYTWWSWTIWLNLNGFVGDNITLDLTVKNNASDEPVLSVDTETMDTPARIEVEEDSEITKVLANNVEVYTDN